MAEAVYLLCALTSTACAVLLLRSFFQGRSRLLLWSSLAFVGLALNNALLFVDLVLIPDAIDLAIPRSLTALAALTVLAFGLIWEAE